jgi:hypothetical protein
MLCIRISEREYEGLKLVCKANGSRSISDLAREAVSRLIGYSEESTPPELARRVEEIDLKVEGLKGDLRRLQGLIELADSTTTLKHDDLALDATNGT